MWIHKVLGIQSWAKMTLNQNSALPQFPICEILQTSYENNFIQVCEGPDGMYQKALNITSLN